MDHEDGSSNAQAEVPHGCIRTNRPVTEAEEHGTEVATDHGEDRFWSIEGQQWLTPNQLGRARWVCVNLSGPGPFGLVPRSTSSNTLDMTGHSDLIRVLSAVWELPFAAVKAMDGLAVWQSHTEGTTVKVPQGADQLLLVPRLVQQGHLKRCNLANKLHCSDEMRRLINYALRATPLY